MKHLGDITKISGFDAPTVNIICGGSPCQDLSVAGLRKGLAGERSGLFMEQIRIIKEMREHDRAIGRANQFVRPRFMVWENVAGAFSSNKGEDFRIVLEETAKIADENAVIPRPPKGKWTHAGCIMGDGWSIAWRLHDAQFWGVPQRRKRIALVADFAGGSAPEILFERESVQGDFEKSERPGEGFTADIKRYVDKTVGKLNHIVYDASRRHNYEPFDDVCETVQAHYGTGDGNVPLVLYDAFQHHGWRKSETCGTLTVGQNDGVRGDTPLVFGESSFGNYALNNITSLRAKGGSVGDGGENIVVENPQTYQNVTGTLDCGIAKRTSNQLVANDMFVCNEKIRRLTPCECERLQGFPDGWTDIGDWIDSKGKKHKGDADAPRYRALGNSIALPFWQWMAQRMVEILKADGVEKPTMASLFDGIGGFPLVFSRCGCKPIWASEIEEFPIAVTKKRFAEEDT